MGQKVSPLVLRLGFIRNWNSRWFASRADYPKFIHQDYNIRKFIKERFKQAAVSKIVIERLSEKIKIRIFSARPGIIIGRHGADIERLREDLNSMVKQEIAIDIEEIKNPAWDAQLVAENIAFQQEKRVAFRRAVKRAMEQSINSGVKGIRVCCAGRLNGAELSRTEMYKTGKVPLQTFRADIDYGFAEALTTYGLIGVKVWIYKGDILGKKEAREGVVEEDKTALPLRPDTK
ncbi:MAG: 30S ribosomal protein S3 [Candidatus Omnitrophica bacterium CG08_land_8_20_14_0_20_41_16]|uniref:Small ribosomal subunit protein uS3 n=1 Tax=Candidatus Sherwoodlollariibacterium unditelluris TaxID=1974757 RepID=A0A2G9YHE3_9BACT|nr:MAG: 30S ribosomal protein S3 [Candidatus Omnitrophica bacterium CG23_combo_of_CG06-09_8_20_14_all_41_10]PIS33803.1 MAG: 30S ribosomal protein S3 [Candidatus Omnitrophica bacterium CG08_land_8_20_14_0_20_41_16]